MNINQFLSSKTGKEIADTFDSTKSEHRSTLIESLADLKAERNSDLEPLKKDLQRKTTALENAQHAVVIAQANQQTAGQRVHKTQASYKRQLSLAERELHASAPTSINELIEQITVEKRELASKPPLHHVTGVNEQSRLRAKARNASIQASNARLQLLHDGISKCDDLRLQSLEDIATGISKIRKELDMPAMSSMQ